MLTPTVLCLPGLKSFAQKITKLTLTVLCTHGVKKLSSRITILCWVIIVRACNII